MDELSELVWQLRGRAAAQLRIELLRKTWPGSPPEWLEEEEARDLLRSHLEPSHLPVVLQAVRCAPRGRENDATKLRSRSLLSLVEPCELHVLEVQLEAVLGLALGSCQQCQMRLRLGEAGNWLESSNFLIAAVQFHGSAGALLDADFQFPVPVSSGDSLAKLFSGKGLELQLVTGSDVLQGEVSPFELHLETPGEVANCIHLEPASSSSTGIKSCSVPGLVDGPHVYLKLKHSHAEAPLDALPYWMLAAPTTQEFDQEVLGSPVQLSMRSLSPMPGAMERAVAEAKKLGDLQGDTYSFRVLAVQKGLVLCQAETSEFTSSVTSRSEGGELWLMLELLLWLEGALVAQLSLYQQRLHYEELLSWGEEPVVASFKLGPWAKLEVELAVPKDAVESPDVCDAEVAEAAVGASVDQPAEAMASKETVPKDAQMVMVGREEEPWSSTTIKHTAEESMPVGTDEPLAVPEEPGSSPAVPVGTTMAQLDADTTDVATPTTIELDLPWLDESPRALLSRVVQVAQSAVEGLVDRVDGRPSRQTEAASVAGSPGSPTWDLVSPNWGVMTHIPPPEEITTSNLAKKATDTVSSAPCDFAKSTSPLRPHEPPDEPEPAAEEPVETEALYGGGVAMSGAAPLPKRELQAPPVPLELQLSGSGAGVPPPKTEAPSVCQLGGRGPLPPELSSETKARDLTPAIGAIESLSATAGPTSPEFHSPEPEEVPMVSFRRTMDTSPLLSPASAVSVEHETTWPSRLDGWCATRSPPRVPQKPRWAMTWSSSPPALGTVLGLGSTRSTMTPRQRLEELAMEAKGVPDSPHCSKSSKSSKGSVGRWSDRLDVNTKRLARIMRSMGPSEESSDSG